MSISPTLPIGNTRLWYLLPIFLGLIGGIIMFASLRNENREMAVKGLLLSIVIQFIPILWFLTYSFGIPFLHYF